MMLQSVAGVIKTIVTLPFASTVNNFFFEILVLMPIHWSCLILVLVAGSVLTNNVLSVILAGN